METPRTARYFYSVWLRHLVKAGQNGLSVHPHTVLELGPGSALGLGLAALMCGAEKYYALDVNHDVDYQKNLEIFDGLVALFRERSPIPDRNEFPKIVPFLDSYQFPGSILTEERLEKSLQGTRLARIRAALTDLEGRRDDTVISYLVPWQDYTVIPPGSIDLIISQAVMEHVSDLETAYRALSVYLKPGGFMSHAIDFKSHDLTKEWNGHWTYSKAEWKTVRKKQVYPINRQPHSKHLAILKSLGLEIVADLKVTADSPIQAKHLSRPFRKLSSEDLTVCDAFIQALKPLSVQ